jgi:hypothetical protein
MDSRHGLPLNILTADVISMFVGEGTWVCRFLRPGPGVALLGRLRSYFYYATATFGRDVRVTVVTTKHNSSPSIRGTQVYSPRV